MLDYHIRLYKDSDYETVRDIFARGTNEHYPKCIRHTFSLPRVWMLILAAFLIALTITGSAILSIVSAALVILALVLMNLEIFYSYVRESLADDMLDIRKYYFQRGGCCFWVAESAGEIVGTVAAAPFPHSGGENQVELRRLSVAKKHRGKGIGKALCKTAMDFAQNSGYEAIVLETTVFQIESMNLYKKLGFRIIATNFPKYYFFNKFIDFIVIYFQYDLSKQR